ncbi:hypothetical protein GCM10011586_26580 [Silvibacterium dinghuense]|nr:hypothetical protein GCM10011586_26580 [Silvibacterium dinghuense]
MRLYSIASIALHNLLEMPSAHLPQRLMQYLPMRTAIAGGCLAGNSGGLHLIEDHPESTVLWRR